MTWNERGEETESRSPSVVADFDGQIVTPPVRCATPGAPLAPRMDLPARAGYS